MDNPVSGIRRPFEQDENGDWYSVDMRDLREYAIVHPQMEIPTRQEPEESLMAQLMRMPIIESRFIQNDLLIAMDPAMLRANFRRRLPMEDQVRLFDEAEVAGIKEVMVPIAVMPSDLPKAPEIILPEKKPILYADKVVYASASALYLKDPTDAWIQIAQCTYDHNIYQNDRKDMVEACATEYGLTNIPVFCLNREDIETFKKLEDKIEIRLRGTLKYIAFFTCALTSSAYPSNSETAVIVYDGNTIRYCAQNGGDGHIGLTSPIRETPAELFGNIMRFLNRSVRGVKNLLKMEQQQIREVLAQRSEDMFSYLQDVTPSPDKAGIHAELLGILEKKYTDDALVIQDRQRRCDEHTRAIRNSKSQLPSGKKGKALRESYLKSSCLGDLLDWFEISRGGNQMVLTFHFRQDLTLEADGDEESDDESYSIWYGRPSITIYLYTERANSRDGSYITRVTATSRDLRAFMHPHLDGQRSWCLGTYIAPLSHAIVGGNIPMAASLLWQYLNNFNPESPLVQIGACAENMEHAQKKDLIVRRR